MINNLNGFKEKNANYIVFSPNGNILKNIPEDNISDGLDVDSKFRTFGPFASVSNTLAKPLIPNAPNAETKDLVNNEEVNQESTLADILGSSILGGVAGHIISSSIPGVSTNLTSGIEKGIHATMSAVEISDSADKKQQAQPTAVANDSFKSSHVIVGKSGVQIADRKQFIENLDASKEIDAAKALNKSASNLTAQEKFNAKHRTFGKK